MKPSTAFLWAAVALPLSWLAAVGADTSHNFTRWEKDIAAFEQADRVAPPPKGALLFTGASYITRWTTLAQDFAPFTVINRGFGGSEIADVTHFASRVIFPYEPRAIYLRSGGNDLARGASAEQVFADFKEFAAAVHAKLPDTDIVFLSLTPSIARRKQADKEKALNALVADYTKGKPHLRYLDTYDMVLGPDGQPRPELFAKDGLHLNAEGYKVFAARIRPELSK